MTDTLRQDNRHLWALDPGVVFLNHGSYGACPTAVLDKQSEWRALLEREPVYFFQRLWQPALDDAREVAARFVGAEPEGMAFVPNATAAVNAVLRSLDLAPGDELLVTDVTYGACRNAADYVAERSGARVVVAPLPFPCAAPEAVTAAILAHVTPRTKLALVDWICSPTALVLPVHDVTRQLQARGVEVLVDAAHAPGQVPMNLAALGAEYATGNFHKWTYAPKGAAFLYVRPDKLARVRPLAISHGATLPLGDRSRFHLEHDWTGTHDPTAYLCVPECIRHLGAVVPGGWDGLMARNHALALAGRDLVAQATGLEVSCPDEMVGSMAAFVLPPTPPPRQPGVPCEPWEDPLKARLWHQHRIEIPAWEWPALDIRVLRLSAALHNRLDDYEVLASALVAGPLSGTPGACE